MTNTNKVEMSDEMLEQVNGGNIFDDVKNIFVNPKKVVKDIVDVYAVVIKPVYDAFEK